MKNFLKHLILGALLMTTGKVVGQATVTGNVATATSDFLGWNATSPANDFALRVKHEGNWPIEWYTDAVRRMMLNPTQSPVINGFTVPTDGFLGLSGHPVFFNGVGPFSRLHLADNSGATIINEQQFGFRDWQRNGITFTGNADQGYLGQKVAKESILDYADMVLHWSDKNRLRQPWSETTVG